jgi:Flp pilus assembly pilin Flp
MKDHLEQTKDDLVLRAKLAYDSLRRLREETGQTAVEYIGIIVVLAVLIGAVVGGFQALDLGKKVENAANDVFDAGKGDKGGKKD